MYFFYYTVSYWDELNGNMRDDSGITCGEKLEEAILNVLDYYGMKNVNKVSMEYITDESTVMSKGEFPNTISAIEGYISEKNV